MSNVNIESVFSEYVLKAIQGIRNSKLRPNNHTTFDYITKTFATNADASLIDTTIQTLLNNNLIENRPTNKGDSFFIKHTFSDFHGVSCKEKTNNCETLGQATQTSALLNHSYVSNDVFDVFYVDYVQFKKYLDDINSFNSKNEVCENINWIAGGINYMKNHPDMIENSFRVCRITTNDPGKVRNDKFLKKIMNSVKDKFVDEVEELPEDEDPFSCAR